MSCGPTSMAGMYVLLKSISPWLPTYAWGAHWPSWWSKPDNTTNLGQHNKFGRRTLRSMHFKRSNYLTENVKTLYLCICWDGDAQCTNIIRQKVKALDNFLAISAQGDGLKCSKPSRTCCSTSSARNMCHTCFTSQSIMSTDACSQGKYMATQVYLEQFQIMIDVIEHIGALIGNESRI